MNILYSEKIAKELGFKNEGLGILSDFAEPLIVTKNTKGFFETKFAYSAKGYLADEIVKGAYIKQVVDESGRQLVFEIYETEHDKVESIIYVVAELKLFVDMKRSAYKETKLENVTVEDVAQSATTVCDPPINCRVTGDSMVKVDFEVEDTNPYDVLFHENGILNLTGAELLVREDELHFSDHIGKRKIIEIHENDYIDNLKIKRNNKEQVTRIIPVTTIRYDKVVKVDDRHSKETIEKKVYGKAVVSSKVKDKGYPVITKFVQYQNETTEEKTTKEFEKEQKVELSHYKYENVEALNKEAELFFSQNAGIDEPEMTVSFDGLGLYKNVFNQTVSVDLYDTVMIYTDEFPKGLEMQVVESEFDGTLEKVISIKLSTKNISMKQALDNINSGRVSEQRLQWEINQRNQNQILQNFIFNDKGQRLEFGSVLPDPKEYRENDTFFLNDDSIYRLVNGAWKFEVGLLSKAMIDDKLKQLESQATEANQKIIESNQKADSILTGLGVKDIRSASREIANKLSSFATQKNIDESILNDKKVKDTRSDNQPPSWYWSNYPYQVAREFKQRSVLGIEGSTNYGLLTTNVQYQDASGSNITQVFESADGTFRRRSEGYGAWTDWQREANEDYVNTLVTKENGLLRAEITALENGVYKKSDFSISPNKIQSAIDSLENDVYKKSDFKMTPDNIVASIVNISDDLSTNIYKKSDFKMTPEQIIQSIESTEQSATELTTKYNRISNSVESMQQIIGNKDNVARLVMGSSIYQTEISNLANPNILIDSLFTPFKRTTNYLFHSFDLASKMIDGNTYTIRIAGMIPDNKTSYRLYNSGGTVFLTDVSKSDRIGTVAVSTGITNLYEKTFVWRESYNGSATVDSKTLRIYNYPSTVNGEMYVMWATLVEGNKGKNWQASQVELKSLSTQVTQLEDSWGVQIKSADDVVSSINATTKGLKFKGDLIDFDGLVNANKAIIKNAVMDSLVANDVTTYIGKFSKLISTYIDARSITGMNSEFIKSLWNGINNYVSITGDAIQINGYDGDRGITLGPKSMTFFSDTGEGARFINANMYVKDRYELYDTGQNAVGLSALERHNIWFGYYDPSEQIHRRLITINQENAKLIVHAPMFSHQSHYRAFQFDTGGYISNRGGGVALRNTAYGYAQLFMADDGSIYIRHSGTGNFVSWNELVDKVFPPSPGYGSTTVPDKSSTYKYDYPRAGEGFYRVAIRNGLTLNQLMALNPQYTIYSTITVNTRLRVG